MKSLLTVGAVYGFVSVLAGAVGAHALKDTLERTAGTARFHLAKDYLMVHALAAMVMALLVHNFPKAGFHVSGWSFLLGALLFCGALFCLALTGKMGFAHVAPMGGLVLLFGWAWTIYRVCSL